MRKRDWKDYKDDLLNRFFEAWQDPQHYKIRLEYERWEVQRARLYQRRWLRPAKYIGYVWRERNSLRDITPEYVVIIGDVSYESDDLTPEHIKLIDATIDKFVDVRQKFIDDTINEKLIAKYKKELRKFT